MKSSFITFLLVLGFSTSAYSANFMRSDSGAPIEFEQVESVLSQGGVIANLAAGEDLEIYGFEMHAERDSTIYLSASSEFISAACLDGAFTAEGDSDTARPGEVYVHAYSGDVTSAYEFDVERFLGSSSLSIDPEIRANLANAMSSQKRKKFWGFLEASNTNAQAPVPPTMEAQRRDYLLSPEIINIRKEAIGDAESMARLSAERFVSAMANHEDKAVASLLHPAMFNKKGRAPVEWLTLRQKFAYELANSNLAGKMQTARVEDGSMEDGFQISLENGERYHLQTEPMDAMVFVKSIQKM